MKVPKRKLIVIAVVNLRVVSRRVRRASGATHTRVQRLRRWRVNQHEWRSTSRADGDDRPISPNSIPTFPPITIFLQYAAIRCDIEQYLCDTYEMRNMIRAQIEKTICTERH